MNHVYPGRLLSVEGGDASGKSTQLDRLGTYLSLLGYDVVQTREPGGGPNAERIRTLFLSQRFEAMTELLLMFASRAEHVATVVIPALEAGKVVVTDRFVDSSYAYQGGGRGMRAEVLQLENLVLGELKPDYTLYFKISLEESARRLAKRSTVQANDHFEDTQSEYKARVLHAYEERIRLDPGRFHLINAEQLIGDVTKDVYDWVDQVFVPQNLGVHREATS